MRRQAPLQKEDAARRSRRLLSLAARNTCRPFGLKAITLPSLEVDLGTAALGAPRPQFTAATLFDSMRFCAFLCVARKDIGGEVEDDADMGGKTTRVTAGGGNPTPRRRDFKVRLATRITPAP